MYSDRVSSPHEDIVQIAPKRDEVFRVGDFCDWGQGNEHAALVCEVALLLGQSIERLGCSLGVANVGHFVVLGQIGDVVHLSLEILCAHFLPVKVPVLCRAGVQ